MAQIKIKQVRSTIDRSVKQKRTMEALGLGRIGKSRVHDDTPQIRGMIRIVEHLIEVEDAK